MAKPMGIPRFVRKNVNPRLRTGPMGIAFGRFVAELLGAENPDPLPSGPWPLVIEHALVHRDRYEPVERAWVEIAVGLRDHLTNPVGPPAGPAADDPWHRPDPPVRRFVFATSARMPNPAHVDQLRQLRDEIHQFFHTLAEKHPHLAHLAALEVEVLDWDALVALLRRRPQLIFRWFPRTSPSGRG